eukprot:gnl/TRDRNA2_/TRDRNA2_169871_c0_seq4.p1 gnl/TRDRNA2_/TRDRNA2_169871_c0~~gnl/TRDRNA2_/TRDRNA2_169871_c0_seq4.p1  ORF type:complete len:405 (+),score=99.08 gnl/TRDRNA2_/TRDRNA2_169871_c0_seq4:41-1216(+)
MWNAPSLKYTVPALYQARYMLTMMGFFGVYAGFMYNDFFSVGLEIFPSRWQAVHNDDPNAKTHEFEPLYDVRNEGGRGPYPFGLDPAWHGASNELLYMNSMKMKISVIVGVAQMIAGLFLRWSNAFFERNPTDFFCECLPMMVFMICFFGYMDYMILYKWVTPMENPPSIINSLIAMGMWQHDSAPMFDPMVPRVLMVITVCTVPLMLIPKPLILLAQHKAQEREQQQTNGGGHGGHHGQDHGPDLEGRETLIKKSTSEDEHEHFDFGEIFIHQIIETIEYVLGTVSHTASYLRLWALSLAHQQLSLVFFQKTVLAVMTLSFPTNAIALYVMFAAWFLITLAVLLGMDVLECFLHTLRLHWVEFQSKFYKADGYGFEPFNHRQILETKAQE